MANENVKKKFRKLKSAHVWPSVVFLVIAMILSFVATAAFSVLIITYFGMDRVFTSLNNVNLICNMLTEAQSREEQLHIFRTLQQDSGLSEAIYVLDENGSYLAGFGGQTYDLTRGGTYNAPGEEGICLYPDQNTTIELFTKDMDINLAPVVVEVSQLFFTDVEFDMSSLFDIRQKKTLYELYYWVGIDLPESCTLLVKCNVRFYNGDFILAFLIGVLSTVMMLLPVLFLFINMLNTVRNQKRMTQLIYTDKTTGGNDWMYFEQFVSKLLYSKRKSDRVFAIVDLSLMKYRSFCICHGMEAGEALLQQVDKQLSTFRRGNEIFAHQEKSDFALLLIADSRESCEARVSVILNKLPGMVSQENPVFHAGIYYVPTGRAENSISSLKKNQIDVSEYFNRASSARASIMDDNHTVVMTFDQKLLEEQLWEHKVEEKMQDALDKEEFQVYLQPKYNPVTEELAGAEALVRWVNEEDGFISPGKFIPIFEKNGFIVKLDDYMISHVAKLQAGWLAEGKKVVPVSVNVSRAHFANPDLAQHICKLVDQYQLPHNLLEIELTESAFFDDKEALLSTVRQLKDLGFDISMDDFGAGYSSLNSLKDLPLDVLKLDAEFFRGETDEERGEIVVTQAINLAKMLNMRIVAEGVEKKNQVDFLASQNCDMIQGFYFAKPMPAQEYQERL